ncbi:hypothetical protein BDW75DRAFT_234532 [Aspergillus navahoensis]
MKTFLSQRAPLFTGLTQTWEQVNAAKRAFHVFSQQKTECDGSYTVTHTAFTYILGPDGNLLDHLNDALGVENVTKRLQQLLARDLDLLASDPSIDGGPARRKAASIRHIGNLARQLKGDWSNMMGPMHLNDVFGAYRFQLAYAAYALALAHFHRLPAALGLIQDTFERIIQKMCEPDVCAYLQTLVLLYNSLFNDSRYTAPGSLRLQYDPYLWGDVGGFDFQYDQNPLNDRIYWNMDESGYLGVACEPYSEEVTQGYIRAWDGFGGRLDDNGGYKLLVARHVNAPIPRGGPGMDAWCATLMHSWSPEFLGDTESLQGMLVYGDKHLSPRIQNGGLTYPRNDTLHDEKGFYNMTHPIQANALLPHARLNVPSGLQKLYEKPWGPKNAQHYDEPALTEVDFCIDVYRAVYIPERRTLLFDLAVFNEAHSQGSVVLSHIFERGPWVLKREGEKIAWGDSTGLVGSDPAADVEGKSLRLGVAGTSVTSFVLEWSA